MSNYMSNSDPNANLYGSQQQNIYNSAPYPDPYQTPSFSYTNNIPYEGIGTPYPRTRRRRGCVPCFIPLLFILIGLGVGGYFLRNTIFQSFSSLNPNATPQLVTLTTISVGPHPNIIVKHLHDFVHVHPANSNSQVVVGIRSTFDLGGTNVSFTRGSDGHTITIDASNVSSGTLDLAVPANSDLNIDTNGIEVIGISGQMTLSSPSAPITFIEGTMSGKSKLDNNGGAIYVIQSILSDQVKISNNGGAITFIGSITPGGTYTFDTNGGSIDVTLPQNSAFHLDVTGIIESLTSDFPGISTQNLNLSHLNEIHQDVGNASGTTLTLSINGGAIILHKS